MALALSDTMAYRSGAPLVKRPWTPEEDELLIAAVAKYGAARWSMIATALETGRVGKQCRERWNNHLCPEVKKSEWSAEEDYAIMQGVAIYSTRWCEIVKAPELTGRTDNAIKNRFFSLQRKVKATNGPVIARPPSKDKDEPVAEPKPLSERNQRIMALARELAFSTFEPDRDKLIEQLTAVADEDEDDSIKADDPALQSFKADDFDELLSSPEVAPLLTATDATSPKARDEDEVSAQLHDDIVSTGIEIANAFLPLSDVALRDDAAPPELVEDSSSSVASRSSATSPLPAPKKAQEADEGAGATQQTDVTAAFLGGRHAHKALLAPLSLPLDEPSLLLGESPPKRMRTPQGPRSVSRRPAALTRLSSDESDRSTSPVALSPLSNASTDLEEQATRRAANGTDETLCGMTMTKPSVTNSLCLAMTGTEEPGKLAEVLSLSDFSDLFGEEIANLHVEISPCAAPVSCGKRKAACVW